MPRGYDRDDVLQEGALAWLEYRDRLNKLKGKKTTLLYKVVNGRICDLIRTNNTGKRNSERDSIPYIDGFTPTATFNPKRGTYMAQNIYGQGNKKIPIRKTGWED